jgi:hypothetical protein
MNSIDLSSQWQITKPRDGSGISSLNLTIALWLFVNYADQVSEPPFVFKIVFLSERRSGFSPTHGHLQKHTTVDDHEMSISDHYSRILRIKFCSHAIQSNSLAIQKHELSRLWQWTISPLRKLYLTTHNLGSQRRLVEFRRIVIQVGRPVWTETNMKEIGLSLALREVRFGSVRGMENWEYGFENVHNHLVCPCNHWEDSESEDCLSRASECFWTRMEIGPVLASFCGRDSSVRLPPWWMAGWLVVGGTAGLSALGRGLLDQGSCLWEMWDFWSFWDFETTCALMTSDRGFHQSFDFRRFPWTSTATRKTDP